MKILVFVLRFMCVALVESQFAGLAFQRPCTVCQTGVSSLQLNLPCLNSLIPGLQNLQGGQTCQQFAQCVAIPGSYGRGVCQCYAGYTAVLYSCVPTGQQAITSLITQLINRRPTSTGPTIAANFNCRPQCNLASAECYLRSTATSQTFACGCKAGFQGNGYNCIRSQIPQVGNNSSAVSCAVRCDPVNAVCVNSPGSTTNVCRCKPGFTGNGVQCTPIPGSVASRCLPSCHPTLGQCVYNSLNTRYECQCRLGYNGNGYACSAQTPTNTGNIGTPQRTCTQRCHPRLARCNYLPLPNEYRCQCNAGYTGNGVYCVPNVTPVPVPTSQCVLPCHPTLASCVYNSVDRQFDCVCNQGYRGNGVLCVAESEVVPGTGPYCVPGCDPQYGVCEFNNALRRHTCRCADGYEGNGITCTRISTTTCRRQCHPTAASCSYSPSYGRYRCQCNSGYIGDGVRCTPVFVPTSFTPVVVLRCQPPCSALATCVLNPTTQQRTCECLDGYSGDGQTCTSNGPGTGGGGQRVVGCQHTCHNDAFCLVTEGNAEGVCTCKRNFRGDGVNACFRQSNRCLKNCHYQATCKRVGLAHQCVCDEDFMGDGINYCTSTVPEQSLACNNVCTSNARCEIIAVDGNQAITCICDDGYAGDGFSTCNPVSLT
uniref:stabilin-2-like isoform X2 n=1 Tax=Ciona intestinalis TaxID=7719 RepID=UPI000EF537CC|nr:stabilin-2-like isoform X2 [Ciona intestinalis]|eukprot:XP_026692681.1 stabilin-2-like isoform X2 [Ciona intestinalis]